MSASTPETKTPEQLQAEKISDSTLKQIMTEALATRKQVKDAKKAFESDPKADPEKYASVIKALYEKAVKLHEIKAKILEQKDGTQIQLRTLQNEYITVTRDKNLVDFIDATQKDLYKLNLDVANDNDGYAKAFTKIIERAKGGKIAEGDKDAATALLKRYEKMEKLFAGTTPDAGHPLYNLLKSYRQLQALNTQKDRNVLPGNVSAQIDFFADIDGSGVAGDDMARDIERHGFLWLKKRINEQMGNEIGEQNLRNVLSEYVKNSADMKKLILQLTNKDISAQQANIKEIRNEFISVLKEKIRYFGALSVALLGVKNLSPENARAGLVAIISEKEEAYFSAIVKGLKPEQIAKFAEKNKELIDYSKIHGGFGVPLLFLHYSHDWYDVYDGKKNSVKGGKGEVNTEVFYRPLEAGVALNLNDRAQLLGSSAREYARVAGECTKNGVFDKNNAEYVKFKAYIDGLVKDKKLDTSVASGLEKSMMDFAGKINKVNAEIDSLSVTAAEKTVKKEAAHKQMCDMFGRDVLDYAAKQAISDGREFLGIEGCVNLIGLAAAAVVSAGASAGAILAASTSGDIGTQKIDKRYTAGKMENNAAMRVEHEVTKKDMTEAELVKLRTETAPDGQGGNYTYIINASAILGKHIRYENGVSVQDVDTTSKNITIKSPRPLHFHIEKSSSVRGALVETVVVSMMSVTDFDTKNQEIATKKTAEQNNKQDTIDAAARTAQEAMKTFDTKKMKSEVTDILKAVSSTEIRNPRKGYIALQQAIIDVTKENELDATKITKAMTLLGDIKNGELQKVAKTYNKASDAEKMALLNVVLQETAGDWRIRRFAEIKKGEGADYDNYIRLFPEWKNKDIKQLTLNDIMDAWAGDKNDKVVDKQLAKFGFQESAVQLIRFARSRTMGAVKDSTEIKPHTESDVLAFTSFSQMRWTSETKKTATTQGISPLVGDVELLSKPVDMTNDDADKSLRRHFLSKTPDWVLEGWRKTLNERISKFNSTGALSADKRIHPISEAKDLRKYLLGEEAQDNLKFDLGISFGRFARCGNDVYMLKPKFTFSGQPTEDLKTEYPKGSGATSMASQGAVEHVVADDKKVGITPAGVDVAEGESAGKVLSKTFGRRGGSGKTPNASGTVDNNF